AEQFRGRVARAQRDHQHREAEQLAAPGMRHVMQNPRYQSLADDQHDADEGGNLGDGRAETTAISSGAAPASPSSAPDRAGRSTSVSTIAISSTISQPTPMRPRSVSTKRRS